MSYFFRISNYLEHALFRNYFFESTSAEQLEEELFQKQVFHENHLFSWKASFA